MQPPEQIVQAIERLVVASVGITTVALEQAGPAIELTFAQWRALLIVGSSDEGIRVGALASRIGSAVPTTSRLVRRLEARAMVTAQRDETDRRATVVRLTPAGMRTRAAIVARRAELIRDALAEVGPVSPDLGDGLAQITEALRRFA